MKRNNRNVHQKFISIKIIIIILHILNIIKGFQKIFYKSEITLVSGLFKLETPRHTFDDYLNWVTNLLQINKPIIFYVDEVIYDLIKEKRPKEYADKTIWRKQKFSDLFFYRHYRKALEKTYIIDKAKYKHNVNLFILWNEKVIFLRNSINKNYFNSKYFFWIDAGFFRDKNMTKYINNWPSLKILKGDSRIMLNEIRRIDTKEFNNLMKFDPITHDKFMNNCNMGGAFFGGRNDYFIKFFYFYFKVFKLFMRKNKFIGSEQNLYTIVGYLHPEITNIIHTGKFFIMKEYFLNENES